MQTSNLLMLLLVSAIFVSSPVSTLSASPFAAYDVTVDLSSRHPTNGLAHAGANFLSPTLLRLGVSGNRVGGEDQSVYNPNTELANANQDFYWINDDVFRPFQPDPPPGTSYVDIMLQRTIAANSTLFLLVPTLQFVANDQRDCASFPVAVRGEQQSEYHGAGNGVYKNGSFLSGNWSCYSPFQLQDAVTWLQRLRDLVGADVFDAHVVLQLDNEYDIWGIVHRDVHPNPVTYDELWSFTVAYGSAFKARWPNVRIAAPVSYGWCGYWWSELDGCDVNGTDFKSHGSQLLFPWYLSQIEAYYQVTGVKLITHLDIHHYPQLPDNVRTPAARARFLSQLRTWYNDMTVGDCICPLSASSLLTPASASCRCCSGTTSSTPTQATAAAAWSPPSSPACTLSSTATHTPSIGMQLAVTEWAFGFSDDDQLSALAVAESMAIQGTWGVDWSLHWVSPAEGSVAEQSWQLFWNYDGSGSRLQGDAVRTAAALSPNITAYSFYDSRLQRLHVLLFSHLEAAVGCGSASSILTVQHAATTATTATVYDITGQHWNVTRGQPLKLTGSGDSVVVAAAACGLQAFSARLIVLESVALSTEQPQTVWKPWQYEQVVLDIRLDDPGMGMMRDAYETMVRRQKAQKQQAKAARMQRKRQ